MFMANDALLRNQAFDDNAGLTVSATDERIGSLLDQRITRHWMSKIKNQGGKICAEYVWIGGTGSDLRSKGRQVLHSSRIYTGSLMQNDIVLLCAIGATNGIIQLEPSVPL
jgi:hypothetical protein